MTRKTTHEQHRPITNRTSRPCAAWSFVRVLLLTYRLKPLPLLSAEKGHAPALSSRFTILMSMGNSMEFPFTARCKAVLPLAVVASTWAPCSSNCRQTARQRFYIFSPSARLHRCVKEQSSIPMIYSSRLCRASLCTPRHALHMGLERLASRSKSIYVGVAGQVCCQQSERQAQEGVTSVSVLACVVLWRAKFQRRAQKQSCR